MALHPLLRACAPAVCVLPPGPHPRCPRASAGVSLADMGRRARKERVFLTLISSKAAYGWMILVRARAGGIGANFVGCSGVGGAFLPWQARYSA